MEQGAVRLGAHQVAYLAEGPDDGPLALCLHGYPDTAWTWRHLLPELASAGFRAVAPWMRGYAPTDLAPDGRYSVAALAEDAVALHEALGGDGRAVLVGHDWGAPAAYAASAAAPERWERVVTMAVPPPARFATGLFTYDQLRRSWYMFLNSSPLGETVVGMNDLAFLDRLWADWSPGYDGAEDLARVKDALREPGRLAAALGYYKALLTGGEPVDGPGPQPLLYLHGEDDGCIGVEIAGDDAVVVEGAGHFLHLERPDVVHKHVLAFVAG